jgi:hypothetical protein
VNPEEVIMTGPERADALEGGCTCGHLRYRLLAEPMFVHCCHCRWCQRETGSAFALNALVESARVLLLAGTTEAVDTPSASGKGQTIVRCPRCRVAVWSHYAGAGEAVSFVRVGTLDDPDQLPPDIHIYRQVGRDQRLGGRRIGPPGDSGISRALQRPPRKTHQVVTTAGPRL